MLNAQRRNHERDTTRPAHRDAVSQTPERAAATALARRLPLATPSSIPCHDWQHPRPCAHASRSRAHSPESPRRGARPRFDQLRPLLENQLRNLLYIPTHPILPPRPTKGSNPLAACKTLASPAGNGLCREANMRKRLLVVALMNAASPFVAPRLALRRTLPSRRTRLHSETQIDNLERSWNISRPGTERALPRNFSDGGDRRPPPAGRSRC